MTPPRIPDNDPRIQKGIALWDEGMPVQQAAKEAGVNKGTLGTHLRRTGRVTKRWQVHGGPACGAWKGGRSVTTQGYISVWIPPTDPLAEMKMQNGQVTEHRLVMARHLGRPLKRNETVHHLNGDKQDNRLENLQLRVGHHGSGGAWKCADCGSTHLVPVSL